MTKTEAIAIALRFLKKSGLDFKGEEPEAFLVTRQGIESGGEFAERLKRTRPEVWKSILDKHRDHWSVAFDLRRPKGVRPGEFYVHVDVETGEASIPDVV